MDHPHTDSSEYRLRTVYVMVRVLYQIVRLCRSYQVEFPNVWSNYIKPFKAVLSNTATNGGIVGRAMPIV
jgi:hypothetical protein